MVIPVLFGAVGFGLLAVTLAIGLVAAAVVVSGGIVKCLLCLNAVSRAGIAWTAEQARRVQDVSAARQRTLGLGSSGAGA